MLKQRQLLHTDKCGYGNLALVTVLCFITITTNLVCLQWCDVLTAYALQTTVRDIAVHDKTFVQYRTLQEVFPLKSVCFMLGHPHYGAMGEASSYL